MIANGILLSHFNSPRTRKQFTRLMRLCKNAHSFTSLTYLSFVGWFSVETSKQKQFTLGIKILATSLLHCNSVHVFATGPILGHRLGSCICSALVSTAIMFNVHSWSSPEAGPLLPLLFKCSEQLARPYTFDLWYLNLIQVHILHLICWNCLPEMELTQAISSTTALCSQTIAYEKSCIMYERLQSSTASPFEECEPITAVYLFSNPTAQWPDKEASRGRSGERSLHEWALSGFTKIHRYPTASRKWWSIV